MLRLSDLVAAGKTIYNLSRGSVSQLQNKFRKHIHLTLVSKNVIILSCLSDFTTCRECFNI